MWSVVNHVRVAGVLLLMLAAMNLFLPRYFGWRVELQRVSPLTRQVFASHMIFIVLIVVMMGVLSLCFAPALVERTTLARVLLGGLAIFWFLRLLAQFFVYNPQIWRRNRFKTAMHVLFSVVWTYLSAVYGAALVAAVT